ncbi:hypothetical protein B0H67DRAFT_643225 [Lasiosphaeris hirsuta]|uniref:Uncharacterized protein n=1 Tax=Lasiosphaeris hirsuta TaxID=260670 RepID=A0AA40AQ64_9PEZI|nr:hypothetical protein B0H67DRAFT_643225 [Lasiosphaeris hirsuta]
MSGRRVTNYRTYEAQSRLLAAVVAAHPDFKPNYKAIAQYYGGTATPSAIEHRFRPLRHIAEMFRMAVGAQLDPEKLDIDKSREEIAKMYGESTQGGIEFQFRGVRQNAEVLRNAAEENKDPKEAFTAATGIGAATGATPQTPKAGSARKRKVATTGSTAKKPRSTAAKSSGRSSTTKARRTMPEPRVAEDSDVDSTSQDYEDLDPSPTNIQTKKRARTVEASREELRISPPIFDLGYSEKTAAKMEPARVTRGAIKSCETITPTETEVSTPIDPSLKMSSGLMMDNLSDQEDFPDFSEFTYASPKVSGHDHHLLARQCPPPAGNGYVMEPQVSSGARTGGNSMPLNHQPFSGHSQSGPDFNGPPSIKQAFTQLPPISQTFGVLPPQVNKTFGGQTFIGQGFCGEGFDGLPSSTGQVFNGLSSGYNGLPSNSQSQNGHGALSPDAGDI